MTRSVDRLPAPRDNVRLLLRHGLMGAENPAPAGYRLLCLTTCQAIPPGRLDV